MKLHLTLACNLYDRTVPLLGGLVSPDGIDLNYLVLEPTEIFRRQARHAEFDVAEFSLATLAVLLARGDRRLVAIPVFPSRRFRHSNIYVNTAAGIRSPEDLAGTRVGAQEYQQTAGVWARGILQHDYGVGADQMEWYFGAYNAPEPFVERTPLRLPPRIHMRTVGADQCLDQMLERGEIDALIGSALPASLRRGSPHVTRLFPDFREQEAAYYRRTNIFPIMHTVVIKREIYEQAPWVAASLYKAFERSKAMAVRRLWNAETLFVALPWLAAHVEETEAIFGRDPFVYGLEANRHVLEPFLQYCHEQGLTDRALTIEDLFAPETHGEIGPGGL
ncbi:MAG: ABC transporter substrate-binding protein [Chloroflexi bacterium]|nr:ABC transporter substrate-binding protein [Chloroflexota bacterium]